MNEDTHSRAASGPFVPFAVPAFTVLWAATVLSNVGTRMLATGRAWLMTTLSPSPLLVAAVQAARTAPIFLFALLAGALSDLFDKRRVLLICQSLAALAALACAVLVSLAPVTPVHSPQFYAHWQMLADARRLLPAEYPERALYVVSGSAAVAGRTLDAGQMAVLEAVHDIPVEALTNATVMVLGGEPVGERFMFWNFVSSSKERLEQAAEDWKQGRMKLPVGDDQEFTPLPERKEI